MRMYKGRRYLKNLLTLLLSKTQIPITSVKKFAQYSNTSAIMQTFTASALFLSTFLVPALAASSSSAGSSAAATTTSTGSSATHTVQVGADGFVFTPDSVVAAVGEIVEFHYTGSNLHDVVQGPFSSPCSDLSTGIYSGYVSTSDVFQVTINSTSPMWLYCSTLGHCQGGMVMVVNQA
jgi:plastocyanin